MEGHRFDVVGLESPNHVISLWETISDWRVSWKSIWAATQIRRWAAVPAVPAVPGTRKVADAMWGKSKKKELSQSEAIRLWQWEIHCLVNLLSFSPFFAAKAHCFCVFPTRFVNHEPITWDIEEPTGWQRGATGNDEIVDGSFCSLHFDLWEFQDPKMEVLYHIRPYCVGLFPYIALIYALYMVGTSNLGSWNGHWFWWRIRRNPSWYLSANDDSMWLQFSMICGYICLSGSMF